MEAHEGPNITIAANDSKPSIGKTGVHLRYHKHHEYMKLMHEQRRELSEWRQNNPDAHKPTHVKKPPHAKKPHVTGGPVKSKQISMLVSQQVAAQMKKYNPSTHAGSTNTEGKASADDDEHLMARVQSAISKHFAARTTQPTPIRRLPPSSNPPPNWKEAQVNLMASGSFQSLFIREKKGTEAGLAQTIAPCPWTHYWNTER